MASDSDVLNALDAAAFLGVHVETLRKLARRDEIPCFKIGKDWRFRKEALLRWADEQRSGGSGGAAGSALVVDDEQSVVEATGRFLEQIGFRVRKATSGARGLELVAEEAPDLILLDLQMPHMNGPQFLEQLRKAHPALPVVIVTGHPKGDLMKQAMHYAPIMLLPKPTQPELLERTIRTIMDQRGKAVG